MTGRRDDGYHNLDSLVVFTDLYDVLKIEDAPSYHLTINNSEDCSVENNLVTQATHLIAEHFKIQPRLLIDLTKNIPLGAGLGGGSADAAAILLMLNDYWNLQASPALLEKFASALGSDIVACLKQKPVIMRETGNILCPAPQFPTLYGILVHPRTPCATPWVYKTYAISNSKFSTIVKFPENFKTSQEFCDFLKSETRNDLTAAAIAINPDVDLVLSALNNLDDTLLTRMSGSGSTCFAIFATKEKAIQHSQTIQKNNPEWWVKPVTIAGKT